jgi:AraC-like DNA-binding protein
MAYLPSYIRERGGCGDVVLAAAGVTESEILSADCWLDVERMAAAWEAAAVELNDELFGIRFAQSVPIDSYGPISYLVLNAPDVRTGAENLARYGADLSFGPAKSRGLRIDGPTAVVSFSFSFDDRGDFRQLLEGHVTAVGGALERLTGSRTDSFEYRFQHDLVGREDEIREVLGRPIVSRADHYGVAFDAELLELPVLGADRSLLPLLERRLSEFTQRGEDVFLDRLQDEIGQMLCDGMPTVERVARRMGLSERSLQRRLKEAGLKYKTVVLELRMQLAKGYLEQPDIQIAEIATLLGYQEVSSFNHAFRRRCGVSPRRWRNGKSSAD